MHYNGKQLATGQQQLNILINKSIIYNITCFNGVRWELGWMSKISDKEQCLLFLCIIIFHSLWYNFFYQHTVNVLLTSYPTST